MNNRESAYLMRNGNAVMTIKPVIVFCQLSYQKLSEPRFDGVIGKESHTTREKTWDHPGNPRRRCSKVYG